MGGLISGAVRIGTINGGVTGIITGLIASIGVIGLYSLKIMLITNLQISTLILTPLYGLLYGFLLIPQTITDQIALNILVIYILTSCIAGLLGGTWSYKAEGERNVKWLIERERRRRHK